MVFRPPGSLAAVCQAALTCTVRQTVHCALHSVTKPFISRLQSSSTCTDPTVLGLCLCLRSSGCAVANSRLLLSPGQQAVQWGHNAVTSSTPRHVCLCPAEVGC
jgi:hypothetical protein